MGGDEIGIDDITIIPPKASLDPAMPTGSVSDSADLAGWFAQVGPFVQSDTKKERTRWRVGTRCSDDEGAPGFLWSGLRSGSVRPSD